MNKTKRSFTIKKRFLTLVILLGIGILLLFIFSLSSYYSVQLKMHSQIQTDLSAQVLQRVEDIYNETENILKSIAYNKTAQSYLTNTNTKDTLQLYQQVYSLMLNSKSINSSILDIALLDNTNNLINIYGDSSVYESVFHPSQNFGSYFHEQFPFNTGKKLIDCQIITYPIYQLNAVSGKQLGVLYLAIQSSLLIHPVEETSSGSQFIIQNGENQLVTGDPAIFSLLKEQNERSATNSTFQYEKEDYRIAYHPILNDASSAPSTLITLFSKTELNRNVLEFFLQQAIIMIVIFASISLLLFITYVSISKSLGLLTDVMLRIGEGNRKPLHDPIVIDSFYPQEVKNLAQSFNTMLEEIDTLNHKIFDSYTSLYELEMMNRHTEIAYLRSQINPHFLYNTLAMISGLSASGEQDLVISVTESLSQMYHYSITGKELVTVEEELAVITSYVDIQMLRFDNRFTTTYDISSDALLAEIPKMILQPIVENAIIHGLEQSLDGGILHLGGRRNAKNNTLVLWVYDTGVGMSEQALEALRKKMTAALEDNHSISMNGQRDHIGLNNANSRIRLYYGKPYQLYIDSQENIGTNVQIKIPYIKP